MPPRASQPRPRRGHLEQRHEAREEHSMSMWETPETPAGPAGGDDIALTTPISTAAPSLGAPAGDTCQRAGVCQGRAGPAAARPASRRNGPSSAPRWEKSGTADTATGRATDGPYSGHWAPATRSAVVTRTPKCAAAHRALGAFMSISAWGAAGTRTAPPRCPVPR